jgi:TBC1 domain family protein 5
VLRYPTPDPHSAESFVQDGLYLEQHLTPEGGAFIISKYSGKPPVFTRRPRTTRAMEISGRGNTTRRGSAKQKSEGSSPNRPPGISPHRGLESLFQDVTEGVQRRTETWGVAKAVRGAMVEARRNIQNIQSSSSSPIPSHGASPVSGWSSPPKPRFENARELNKKLQALEARNKALSKMLGDALNELRIHNNTDEKHDTSSQEASDLALARIQFVQVYLEDSTMPIPSIEDEDSARKSIEEAPNPLKDATNSVSVQAEEAPLITKTEPPTTPVRVKSPEMGMTTEPETSTQSTTSPGLLPQKSRTPLADSSLSWMLGENKHRNSFVSSASAPPEQSRNIDAKGKHNHLFGDNRSEDNRRRKSVEEDGLILSSLGEESKKS